MAAAAAAAAAVALVLAWAYRRWRPFRIEVRGGSMAPTLVPGDLAVATVERAPRRGDVVVLEHPDRPGFELVKRVVGAQGDLDPHGRPIEPGWLWVEGDDPVRSTDSRRFGLVGRDAVRGTVRLVYWPPARWKVLRSGA